LPLPPYTPRPRGNICQLFPGLGRFVNRALSETLLPLVEELALRAEARIVPVHSVYPCTLRRLPDGTHPDAAGARLIAETVFASLTRHLPE